MRIGRRNGDKSGPPWTICSSEGCGRAWRILLGAWIVLLPLRATADGKVFAPVAFAANVNIPDQRALICYTNGVERLVIETRFTGAGTNFAWVVPLPDQPVVEEASPGLFPTLDYLFRPQIVHDVRPYFPGFLALIGVGYLLLCVRPVGRMNALDIVACLLVGYSFNSSEAPGLGLIAFVALFGCVLLIRVAKLPAHAVFGGAMVIVVLLLLVLPSMSLAKTKAMSSASQDQAITILDRRLVGVFETTTIASRDPGSLQTWLRENEFAVPTNSAPVIDSYVKDGWVFVAAKVRRDQSDDHPSTPHPLSFTFKTGKPVYPMRLTGVDNGPLEVELYVFGAQRAVAPHLKVERCTRPAYPYPPEYWSGWTPETPNIVHPLLRRWTDGLPVATKLAATLTPADMRQDVWIEWTPFSETRSRLFSHAGAWIYASNWGAGVLAAGLLACVVFTWIVSGPQFRGRALARLAGGVTVPSMALVGMVYLALPKTEIRLVKNPSVRTQSILYEISWDLLDDAERQDHWTRAEASARARDVITVPQTNAPYWKEWSTGADWPNWQNYLQGGPVLEQDSPGNYLVRETGDRLDFVVYDAQGAEHVLRNLPLRRRR